MLCKYQEEDFKSNVTYALRTWSP